MTKRKFFKTTIKVEVLTEEKPLWNDLSEVVEAMTDGGASGVWNCESVEEIDGATAARELQAQASEPGFFRLDDEGNDDDSEEEV